MKRILLPLLAVVTVTGLWSPPDCPAPLIWRKGEGWSWEREGVSFGKNPAEQLALARKYQAAKEYGNAISAYRRLLRRWPTAFATEDARLGMAECFAGLQYYYRAFKTYQELIEKNPASTKFEQVLQRQIEIGNLFLGGQRDKAFGIKWFPSMEKAVEIFQTVVKNGPYSSVGPQAQDHIGLAYERQKDYVSAVRAYEMVIERYPKLPIAELAQWQIGSAYRKEARRAEYDQNAANQAIAAYTDFIARYPQSDRVPVAENYRTELREEQARGLFQIGQYYEKQKQLRAATIYYHVVIEKDPKSAWAAKAQTKVTALNAKLRPAAATIK